MPRTAEKIHRLIGMLLLFFFLRFSFSLVSFLLSPQCSHLTRRTSEGKKNLIESDHCPYSLWQHCSKWRCCAHSHLEQLIQRLQHTSQETTGADENETSLSLSSVINLATKNTASWVWFFFFRASDFRSSLHFFFFTPSIDNYACAYFLHHSRNVSVLGSHTTRIVGKLCLYSVCELPLLFISRFSLPFSSLHHSILIRRS